MKQILSVVALLTVVSATTVALGQTKAIRMFTPAERAIMDRAGQEDVTAAQLLRDGKPALALTAVSKSISELAPLNIPGDYYLLARCQTALGHNAEALEAYKNSFAWDKTKGDLVCTGSSAVPTATDYAILLTQNGRFDDAKQMYYFALRNLNPYGATNMEPYPFTVVFDTSTGGDSWAFEPAHFQAACLMVKAIAVGSGDDFMGWVNQASSLAPEWLYPDLYRGFRHLEKDSLIHFARARALAKNADERVLIERVSQLDIDHMPMTAVNPAEVRGSISILQTSKEELAKVYPRLVASTQKASK